MSYEDSFEREAADERAYENFEAWYVYENLRPPTIGKWEWDLMFDKAGSHYVYSDALRDAKEMALELGRCVEVTSLFEGCYRARPDDFHVFPTGSSSTTYTSKRCDFVKALVIAGRYPDLVKIARESNDRNEHGISRHHLDEIDKKHRRWQAEAALKTDV